ncbi:protein of unknown function [Oscillibacter sp. PC13]|uniref:DUF4179 domain-containing protein n=1 Tax=Oscillibacter sp. PC13 TaxID=1855299 RepID=UPI0008ED85B0|nr:DUF4179 domain-containing protein [Oscillibacter sp. PC13]SFP14912.1 protein of unknown function [Oscillibacter sp. PC13]
MTRNEEYAALLATLEETPPALEGTVERALARKRAVRNKKRIFGIPAVSLAACFAAFVLLVNLFPPFAAACGGVPVLRELAKAVAWSPSLSAAVENDYVQPMGQSQTVNGITATVEYVIVDQKQLNIFFTLKGDYDNLSAEMPDFSPEQHCAVQGADYREAPGTLLHFTLDYMDADVPEGFTMTFGATTYVEQPYDWDAPESSILDEREEKEPDILAEFTFDLRFDPTYTAQGERIPVNRSFTLDGQTLTVTEAEVYPTHVRINVAGDENNTAWLEGLEFYLENEDGERFSPISNGISSSGDPDSPAMWSFRLESTYFSRSDHLTLHITGAKWLDKDMERIRVNLADRTAEKLPEGVELYSAERKDGGWIVQFSAPEEEELHFYQLFGMTYYDAEGNPYEMGSHSVVTTPYFEGTITDEAAMEAHDKAGEGKFFEVLPLRNYPADEVWLCPSFSHTTAAEPPVVIAIK